MDRRVFLRQSCTFCLLAGTGLLSAAISSCSAFPVIEMEARGGQLTIPLGGFKEHDLVVVHAAGMLYDIAVRRLSGEEYVAVQLRCTHADNELTPSETGYSCPAHGSRFDVAGHVVRGPAQKPLERYTAALRGNSIIVNLTERSKT